MKIPKASAAELKQRARVRWKVNGKRWHKNRAARWGFLHVTLDKDEHAALKALAAAQGTTLSDKLRTYVTWGLETEGVA